jgi:L,D-transpeptidase YbiS
MIKTAAAQHTHIKTLQSLIEKLILDGEHLATVAETFQATINGVDIASDKAENAQDEEEASLAQMDLNAALERRNDYWSGLQSAIHEFRQRSVITQAALLSDMSTPSTDEQDMSINPENVDMSATPALYCSQCGVDRFKEDCKGDRMRCDMRAVAHAASAPVTFKPRIVVNLSTQTLELRGMTNTLIRHYRIASAANGPGEVNGSYCTPRGRHIIRAKIGAGMPVGTVFSKRRPTGEIYSRDLALQNPNRDFVLTRILWLSGCEPGFNRFGDVDTARRKIYIHGCPDHVVLGEPSSHGCIRMRNVDVMDLFDLTPVGTPVEIIE